MCYLRFKQNGSGRLVQKCTDVVFQDAWLRMLIHIHPQEPFTGRSKVIGQGLDRSADLHLNASSFPSNLFPTSLRSGKLITLALPSMGNGVVRRPLGSTIDSVQELDLLFLRRCFGTGNFCSLGELLNMLP